MTARETFTCALCERTFERTATGDVIANAEAFALWGVEDASEDPNMEVVCRECFRQMLEEAPELFEKRES